MFEARPGVHMEFIAKCSVDLPDNFTVDQDMTNVLYGILPPEYSSLSFRIFNYIRQYNLPPIKKNGNWWRLRYIIVYKFVPKTILDASLAKQLTQELWKAKSWKFYAILPNVSYKGSHDPILFELPPPYSPIPNELILGPRDKNWYI